MSCVAQESRMGMINSGKYYSIGETAKLAGMTIETLRHYDRIGLLKPAKVNAESGFRYYSDEELVYLYVIDFCKRNNMALATIKQILSKDNYEHIIELFIKAEKETEDEIQRLKKAKVQIHMARKQYENRLSLFNVQQSSDIIYKKSLKERAIVRLDTLQQPSIESFHQIQNVLDEQIDQYMQEAFVFEDSIHMFTGMLSDDSRSSLFVICEKYDPEADCVSILPAGEYLYGFCSEEQRELAVQNMIQKAETEYGVTVPFVIQSIIFTGIFQWDYEIQVPLE